MIAKKHETHAKRTIVDVLKINGVDIQVYFSGAVTGPHCFVLAENADAILSEISDEMLCHVSEERLKGAIRIFTIKMKQIFSLWYSVKRFLTSTDCHSDDAIETYRHTLNKMRTAIVDLVVDSPPLPGKDNPLKLPTTIKAHALLGGDVDAQIDDWRATGSIDEQNDESIHPLWNNMMRRFGNTRGKNQKKLILREMHWMNASFMREKMDSLKEGIKRKTEANRMAPQRNTNDDDGIEVEDPLPCDDEGTLLPLKLEKYEVEMNDNPSLRGPTDPNDVHYELLHDMNTEIVACSKCRKRILGKGAYRVHCHETHGNSISEEVDGGEQIFQSTVR